MSSNDEISVAHLLEREQKGWDEFNAYLLTLSPQQMTTPTDAAGWTVKDHIMHLAVWEDGMTALLNGRSRREAMEIPEDVWERWDYDEMNAIIQRRHRDKPLDIVLATFREAHRRLVATIASFADADLVRPYSSFYPGSTLDEPVIWRIIGNSYGHYEEHRPWIEAIVQAGSAQPAQSENLVVDKAKVLAEMQKGWEEFNRYLATLTEEQLTVPTDAAGWTVKDHLMHLAVWEDGMTGALEGQRRYERMGVDEATWNMQSWDPINAIIWQQHRDKSLVEVLAAFRDAHEKLTAKLQTLSDADLQRPYSFYQPHSESSTPFIATLAGNTYEHYAEHRPWIEAIVRGR